MGSKAGTPCVEKKRYPTEDAAKRALLSTMIAKALRAGGYRRRERRYYACPICKGWHLTGQRKRA
jgi:hypothetical protein